MNYYDSEEKSFVFYPSFYYTIKKIKSTSSQLELFMKICEYGVNGTYNESKDDFINAIFEGIKANIDYSKARRKIAKENGAKGGAPKGNQNARKYQNNQKQPNYLSNNLNIDIDVDSNNDNDIDRDRDFYLDKDIDRDCDDTERRLISQRLKTDNKELMNIAKELDIDKSIVESDIEILLNNKKVDARTGEVIKYVDDYIRMKKRENFI